MSKFCLYSKCLHCLLVFVYVLSTLSCEEPHFLQNGKLHLDHHITHTYSHFQHSMQNFAQHFISKHVNLCLLLARNSITWECPKSGGKPRKWQIWRLKYICKQDIFRFIKCVGVGFLCLELVGLGQTNHSRSNHAVNILCQMENDIFCKLSVNYIGLVVIVGQRVVFRV